MLSCVLLELLNAAIAANNRVECISRAKIPGLMQRKCGPWTCFHTTFIV